MRLLILAHILLLAGCSTWTTAGDTTRQPVSESRAKSLDKFHIQPSKAQRMQRELGKGDDMDADAKIEEIKALFAERNVYNRKPVAARVEGKSQGRGDCNEITMQASGIPLNVFLESVAGDRTLRVINANGDITMDQEINVIADKECDEDLIDRILTSLDIGYTINNDALTVMPRITKSYALPVIKPQAKYNSSTSSAGVSGGNGSNSGGGSSNGGLSGGKVSYTDDGTNVYDELKENVQNLFDDEKSKVTINTTDGTMLVVAKPSEHRRIEKMVASFSDTMRKTVMVTANILEVNADQLEEHGLSMDMLFNALGGKVNAVTDFAAQTTGTAGTIRAFNTNGQLLYDLKGVLREQGIAFSQRTQPSITVNNRTGTTINMGGSEQYVESIDLVSSQGTNGGTGQALPAPKLGILQTGVQLDVWPYILDDMITAQIRLAITDKKGDKQFTFTNVGTFNSPILANSEINTKVTVKSGQTIVISGLTREIDNGTETGIPYLRDIPVLGAFFGHSKKQKTRSEAVIFLTLEEVNKK